MRYMWQHIKIAYAKCVSSNMTTENILSSWFLLNNYLKYYESLAHLERFGLEFSLFKI